MQKKYTRKIYYIKNSAQSKFIFRFILISIIGGLGAVTAFNFLAYKKIDSVLYSMRLPSISPGGLLWNEMMYTNIFVIIFTLIVFAITARGLFIKVNGPLKKITSDINRIAEGDLTLQTTLRDRDEFKDFATDLNLVTSNLNQQFLTISTAADKINAIANGMATDQNIKTQMAEIRDCIASLENTIGSFKI